MTQSLRERLDWQTRQGQIMDADRRYVIMRADVLMGIFRELPGPARAQALQALERAASLGGGASTRAYFQTLQGDADALLHTMAGYSAELGWGVWSFALAPARDALHLEVRNSPFAAGFGVSEHPVCHPIAGILRIVGELALGRPAQVEETACAAQGHAHCRFAVRPATPDLPCLSRCEDD